MKIIMMLKLAVDIVVVVVVVVFSLFLFSLPSRHHLAFFLNTHLQAKEAFHKDQLPASFRHDGPFR